MFNTKIKKLFLCLAVFFMFSASFLFVSNVFAQDALGVDVVGEQTGLAVQDIRVTVGNIIKVILSLLGVVAISLVLYGGFMYMTAGGDETKVDKARKILINAGIGLVIIFSAYAIVSFVTSRLLEATGANVANQGDGGGGGGGLGGANLNAFVSRVISPTGEIAIRNVKVRITFSKDVSEDLVNANNIKITDLDGNAVTGSFVVSGRKVAFTPDAACPAPNEALKCFDANKKYKVVLTPKLIKSTGGVELSCVGVSVCSAEFTTGELVDVTAPEVNFVMPLNDMKVAVNSVVNVNIVATDDAGISNISLSVDGSLLDQKGFDGGTPKEAMFDWGTEGIALGFHTLKGEANDIDDHVGQKEIRVKVLPAECFGNNGDVVCGKAAECGACEDGPCKEDADCAAGFYCLIPQDKNGKCTSLPVITNISPAEGAVGNLVTIVGTGFKSLLNGTSKVFFSGNGGYIEAVKADCGAATWSDNRILAKVPAGVITGPVKVINKDNKFDTTDNDRGWKNDFILNSKLVNPGLCAVTLEGCLPDAAKGVACLSGDVRQNIKAAGEGFGTAADPRFSDYSVYFGEISGALGAGGTWTDKSIRNVKIPNLDEGAVNVVVGKGERCLNEKNETCMKDTVGCRCTEVYSNPIPFRISGIVAIPTIKEVAPIPAHAGQVISLTGENFGKVVGTVGLTNAAGDTVALGLGCENNNSWNDSQILVKLPDPLSVGEYKIIVTTAERLSSESANLTVAAGVPGPALCGISPSNGPRGTAVNFSGKNFGAQDDYKIYFSKTGIANDPGTAVVTLERWDESAVTKAKVPQDAVSGNVYLANEDKSVRSNGLLFGVGSCSGNSCGVELNADGVEVAKKCCPNGVCVGAAEICVEGDSAVLSEFAWVVSTGNLPRILQVVERSCVIGALSQSPSPRSGATDACPNGMISGTFNQIIKKETLSNNIVIKRCTSPVGTKRCKENTNTECVANSAGCECLDLGVCDLNLCNANCVQTVVGAVAGMDIGETNNSAVCTKDGVACAAGSAGCVCVVAGERLSEFRLVSSFSPENKAALMQNDALFKNSWYSVTIKGGEAGVKNLTNEGMPYDYSWKFKTKADNCAPDKLLMAPGKGLIEEVDGEQSYMVSGQYKCESVALNNENWSWGVNDPLFATPETRRVDIRGFGQNVDGSVRKDIGIAILNPDLAMVQETTNEASLVNVIASARIAGSAALSGNVSKSGKLEINFSDPEVTEFYPNCTEACINASIGVKFNTEMKQASMTVGAAAISNVLLYECEAGDCVVLGNLVPLSGVSYQYVQVDEDKILSEATISLVNNLSPNKYYRVILKEGILATNGGKLSKLNYNTNLDETAPKNAYSWTFKTRDNAELCKINAVDVVPGNYISSKKGEKISYSARPRSAGDACNKNGQLLNPFDYEWTWTSSKLNVATVNPILLFGAVPSFCTDNCLSKGSNPFGGVCGNGKVELGEECDDGNLVNTDGCSEVCLKTEFAICNNLATDQNCCGNGKKEGGEECDFGCNYKNNKNEACTKGDAGCFCVSKEASCANGCLNAGTPAGFVCGNGKIEVGEDCDDGNKTAGDGCSDKCLNEGAKYQIYVEGGQTKSPVVCGDGVLEGGEECESVCKNAAGAICVAGADGCVCSIKNNPYCSDRCVWTGFPKCTAANKTTKAICCGNGVKENYIGTDAVDEECEAVCTKKEACVGDNVEGCTNGQRLVGCNFLDDPACTTCIFPAGCNDKCLNTGSSLTAGSVCRDGKVADGEDAECDSAQGAGKQAPNQLVDVVGTVADELYNAEKRFAEDITKIRAVATELRVKQGEQAMSKIGETDLAFRKYSCTLTGGAVAIDASKTVPRKFQQNVCRNASIFITLNQKVVADNFDKNNVKVFYRVEPEQACAQGDLDFGISDVLLAFEGDPSQRVSSRRCGIEITAVNFSEENNKSIIMITPKGLLFKDKMVFVELGGLKDVCGASVSLGLWQFNTGSKACRLSEVGLTPAELFITDPDHQEVYMALAKGEQNSCVKDNAVCEEGTPNCVCTRTVMPIHGVADIYDWNWNWKKGDATIVTDITPVGPVLDSAGEMKAKVTTAKKNGQTTVTATATISVDRLGSQLGLASNQLTEVCVKEDRSACQKGSADCVCSTVNVSDTSGTSRAGTATVEVFICENVWNPSFNAANWHLLEYTAAGSNKKTSTHLVENNNNIGLFYCRDAGKVGVEDDLPKLQDVSVLAGDPTANKRWGVYFDDSGDWMTVSDAEIGNNINFDDAGQSWTIEAWVFNDIMPQSLYKRVFYKNIVNEFGENNIQMYIEKPSNAGVNSRVVGFRITNRNGAVNLKKVANSAPLPLGFNHLALVYNGTTKQAELFINGASTVLIESYPASYVGDKDFYIGSRGKESGTSFGGYVDDMRIWNIAKNASQIRDKYNKVLTGKEANLVAYWNLNRDLLDHSQNGKNNLTATCTSSAKSRCDGSSFQFINLSSLAEDVGLQTDVQMLTIQNEEFNQCADGIDNDKNGLTDMNDPKCFGGGKWEDPKLLAQYFFKRDDGSPDIISLRIYANPEGLSPDLWYQAYAPNPSASTKKIEVDCTWDADNLVRTCYLGARDDASTYIAAGNVAGSNIFNNIYLLGYSSGSDDKTLTIYQQLVNFVRFNQNRGEIAKSSIVQDTRRVSDLVYLRRLLEAYRATNDNKFPTIAGGSYVRGRVLSVWPSWQDELGKALGAKLAIDPDNRFQWSPVGIGNYSGEDCGKNEAGATTKCLTNAYQCAVPGKYCVRCATGFAKETCYNSSTQSFSNDYDADPQNNPLYSYKTNETGSCYELKYRLETKDANKTYRVLPELIFPACR